jgi:hypothetical protein
MTTNIRPTPNNDDRIKVRKTRHHAFHKRGPAGAKFLKAAYKARHGVKPETLAEASAWYRGLQEPRWRVGESATRIALAELADSLRA